MHFAVTKTRWPSLEKNICQHQSSHGGHAQAKHIILINVSHGCDNVAEEGNVGVSKPKPNTTKEMHYKQDAATEQNSSKYLSCLANNFFN